MNCDQAQLAMALYVIDDPSLTPSKRKSFEVHVQACPKCARSLQESRWVLSLVKHYGVISDDTNQLLAQRESSACTDSPMTQAEGWEDLRARIPELGGPDADQRSHRPVLRWVRAAAVAAMVALTCILWNDHSASPPTSSATASWPKTPRAAVELVNATGRESLCLGQPFASKDRKREILLGGMHRMVLNAKTDITVRADDASGRTRYNVDLKKGELYVEVVPGNPFTVNTSNARLVITGTRFNVRCDSRQTKLCLVKGSVRFGNCLDQWTDVIAGHASTIMADAAPSKPQLTDAFAATAWARELIVDNTFARLKPDSCEAADWLKSMEKETSVHSTPPVESLDYDQWTQTHRDYFAREFPWIVRMEEALRDQGIPTDYVTLLMISGDIWQFHYPQTTSTIPVFNSENATRVADHYHLDRAMVIKAAECAKPATSQVQNTLGDQYRRAICRWQSDLADATRQGHLLASPVGLFSLHAASYLSNARTAAYLWVRSNPTLAQRLLSDARYASAFLRSAAPQVGSTPSAWSALLREQISSLQPILSGIQELLITPQDLACVPKSYELAEDLNRLIQETKSRP